MATRTELRDKIDLIRDEDLEVVDRVVQAFIQPRDADMSPDWPAFVEQMYGATLDAPLQRPEQPIAEERTHLK